MMTTAKISVIVPVYNAEPYLHKCIDSILSQTFTNFEVLLIDDGSPDLSGKICDTYKTNDDRVRVFHKENGGASSARNIGLDNAVGDWVCFVDSDDWIEHHCLETVYKCVMEDQLDCLQFSFKRIDKYGNVIIVESAETSVMALQDYIKKGVFCFRAGGTLLNKNIIDTIKLRFIEGLNLGEDQIFMLTALAHCKRMRRIPNAFYCYLLNENSATENTRFPDVRNSIIAYNEFQYKNKFYLHIDTMILAQSFLALRLSDCNFLELYKILKGINIVTKAGEFDSINMRFLKIMWKYSLLFALFVLKLEFKIRNRIK
jgi:glycosyltransferase involved in cell wall biosynthesis